MNAIDWTILGTYLAAALGVGLWLRRQASHDLEAYFLAGRRMPGWLIGTSMVATTFAADTPLAVTGLVAEHGIAGNWFWWSLALSHLAAAFLFARLWRRAEIVTDAELTELRYSGRSATVLRAVRAFTFAIPINCIIMAWVIRAVGKIAGVLFPWEHWLPTGLYDSMAAHWPTSWGIRTPSEALSILFFTAIATCYAILGGLPSVILTDLIQFALAMVGAIALAYFAVEHIGGLDAISTGLDYIYGPEKAQGLLAYFPSHDAAWLPLQAFLVYLLVQWWAQKFSDGGGILVQRMSAARTPGDALRGTTWFVIAHYALRPWPWILVALVALVLYPMGTPPEDQLAILVHQDREMAYPVLMQKLLPAGLLGIMVTSMAAAFMSTIDTHVTWGASYLVRDFYQRFVNPNASQPQLVRAGRWSMAIIILLALGITTQMASITAAWKFLTAIGSGLGLVSMARWVWWRINAASELAGIISAPLTTGVLALTVGFDESSGGLPYHHSLLIIVAVSTVAVVATTLLTAPTQASQLQVFYARVRPYGWWAPVRAEASIQTPAENPRPLLLAWAVAAIGLFTGLFSLGETLLGNKPLGIVGCAVAIAAWWYALRLVRATTDH